MQNNRVFLYSVLGMNLFGCKFCRYRRTGAYICDRKNFDSLLWAIITVFQVWANIPRASGVPIDLHAHTVVYYSNAP